MSGENAAMMPTKVTMVEESTFTGKVGGGQYYILDTGLVQRFYGLPPELIPACGRCGIDTVVDGAIVRKYFYNSRRKLHVWCIEHVPWWVSALDILPRWGWKLFRIPAYKWPW